MIEDVIDIATMRMLIVMMEARGKREERDDDGYGGDGYGSEGLNPESEDVYSGVGANSVAVLLLLKVGRYPQSRW